MAKFTIELKELNELISTSKSEELRELLEKHGQIEGLANKLSTDLSKGLSTNNQQDLENRVQQFGRNEIPSSLQKSKTLVNFFLEALVNFTFITLIVCGVILFFLSFIRSDSYKSNDESNIEKSVPNLEWIEGTIILLYVFFLAGISSYTEWKQENEARSFQELAESVVKVIRDGQITTISEKNLLVGDICQLVYGEIIPADGLVIESKGLKVDESSLTGEADYVNKSVDKPILYSGTSVVEGTAKMLVVAVGENTQAGHIIRLLRADNDETETTENKSTRIDNDNLYEEVPKEVVREEALTSNETEKQEEENDENGNSQSRSSEFYFRVEKINKSISNLIAATALLITILYFIRYSINVFGLSQQPFSLVTVKPLIKSIILFVIVLVSYVPRGFASSVTISLTSIAERMTKDGCLVRHLDACEAIGRATTILVNKTNTLTNNYMKVVKFYINGRMPDYGRMPEENFLSEDTKKLVNTALSVNCSYISRIEPSSRESELPKHLGDQIDCALLDFVQRLGGDYNKIREQYPASDFVYSYIFKSSRRSMSTCINHPTIPGAYRLFTKGACNVVLRKCKYILVNNQIIQFTQSNQNDILKLVVEPIASEGLRLICVAYKDFVPIGKNSQANEEVLLHSTIDWERDEKNLVNGLTLICICGLQDPIRPGVPSAIKRLTDAGVVVRLLTGDGKQTARSIARYCGILNDNCLVMDSKEFNEKIKDEDGHIVQEKFDRIWPSLRVLACSSPEDKYNLAKHLINSKLNSNREVVSAVSDKTSDAPLIKRVDIGFAGGIYGSDLIKEASDIILLNNDYLNSISNAVLLSRKTYDSVEKIFQFQMTAFAVLAVSIIICVLTNSHAPFQFVQFFWFSVIIELICPYVLATGDLLSIPKAYSPTRPIISRTIIKNMICQVFYQTVVLFFLTFIGPFIFGIESAIFDSRRVHKEFEPTQHFTMIFNTYIFMTLFNQINLKKVNGEFNKLLEVFSDSLFCAELILAFGLQYIFVQFGSYVTGCHWLTFIQWIWCLIFAIGALYLDQFFKSMPVIDSLLNSSKLKDE